MHLRVFFPPLLSRLVCFALRFRALACPQVQIDMVSRITMHPQGRPLLASERIRFFFSLLLIQFFQHDTRTPPTKNRMVLLQD